MLSYQHGYHAGNFADVIKHLTLSRLLTYLTLKEKSIFYLETHSGRGIYDLKDNQATKTGEYHQGIGLVWPKEALPAVFSPYLQTIQKMNNTNELRFYPGSPSLAINLLRQQDRLFFCELHPREFESLQQLPTHQKRVFYSHSEGIAQLNALLPPPERRGLVFIDPSYEVKTEYKTLPKALKSAYLQFATGTFCLWYPLIDPYLHQQLLRGLSLIGAPSNLKIEFYFAAPKQSGMTGCGLWIINPSFKLAEEMEIILKQLSKLFNPGKSSFIIKNE